MEHTKEISAQSHPVFRFVVELNKKPVAAFTECTLPVIEWEMEEIKEGGLNTFVHQLPGRRKAAKLTLKNGVGKSMLMDWLINTVNGKIVRHPISITLMNSLHKPVAVWHIENAYPIKWTGPQLKSDANTIAIQSVEFACQEIMVTLE